MNGDRPASLPPPPSFGRRVAAALAGIRAVTSSSNVPRKRVDVADDDRPTVVAIRRDAATGHVT